MKFTTFEPFFFLPLEIREARSAVAVDGKIVHYLVAYDGHDFADCYTKEGDELYPFVNAEVRAAFLAELTQWYSEFVRLPWWAFIRRRRMIRQLRRASSYVRKV